MNMYSADYNKKRNQFEQGISRIRNKNNNFFENAGKQATIYDLRDIKSYFIVEEGVRGNSIQFRKNSGLPAKIEEDIRTLFHAIWPVETADINVEGINTESADIK